MDALLAYIPEWNYWLIAFGVSLLLNVYQFAHAHGLALKLGHMHVFGHTPDGYVQVPAATIAVLADTHAAVPPWERKS